MVRLHLVIILRVILVALSFTVALAEALPTLTGSAYANGNHPAPGFAFLGIIGLMIPVGIPSLVIVVGLRAGQRWAAAAALVYDLAIPLSIIAIPIFGHSAGWPFFSAVMALGLVFGGPLMGAVCILVLAAGFVWESVCLYRNLGLEKEDLWLYAGIAALVGLGVISIARFSIG
jgi:hypothetical protein